jgi:pimeloyl-ACP methyl ester carboxylesterase
MSEQYADIGRGITLCFEEIGPADGPPLLMVAGIGQQMIAWRDERLAELAERGLRVIRFDNRDAGLSTHLEGMPRISAIMEGDRSSAHYTLEDMASDAAGLLDFLGIGSAHVLGVSMGGMIAQALAAAHRERVRSLVSIMSTTGERAVSQATPAAQAVLLGPRPTSPETAERRALESARVIGSPGLIDEAWVRELGRRAYERAFDPPGFARQFAAIWASGDRTEAVRTITAPTLVIHGELDPLIPVAGGRATAAAIDGSELIVLDEMAHDLPPALWPRIADAIVAHVERAESLNDESPAVAGLS